jgi:hypothetical protein
VRSSCVNEEANPFHLAIVFANVKYRHIFITNLASSLQLDLFRYDRQVMHCSRVKTSRFQVPLALVPRFGNPASACYSACSSSVLAYRVKTDLPSRFLHRTTCNPYASPPPRSHIIYHASRAAAHIGPMVRQIVHHSDNIASRHARRQTL